MTGSMIRATIIAGAVTIAGAGWGQTPSADVPPGYTLRWADEFTGEGLPDPARWRFDTHANRTGWYNNELQYYAADRLENARVTNGRLIITARAETLAAPDHGGQRYTSARLITQGRAAWRYGFFEIRAKLPCGAGSWPAIWMLGEQGEWPDGGEIDIMEHVGNDRHVVHSTVHNRATAGTSGDGASITLPSACDAFHRYQLHWTGDALDFAVDGRPVHRYARAGKGAAGWPYDAPQYLLLNLAIGGDMGGRVDDAIFPARFEIDYVRVYQKGAATGPEAATTPSAPPHAP